jgi:hypothetical protein
MSVEEHQNTNIAGVAGTGQKMDRAQDATLTNRGTRQSERASKLGQWEESKKAAALPFFLFSVLDKTD